MSLSPWHQENWEQLLQRFKSRGLPHATVFTGVKGTGKEVFVRNVAMFLLCQSENKSELGVACEQCHSCNLFKAKSHPDFLIAQPEEKSRQIRIDSIRSVNNFLAQTPQVARNQVVIIQPVDVLNTNAANALLKTLEEPAGESYLLLIAERIGSVLPTIRSRCQKVSLPLPSSMVAAQWIQEQLKQEVPDELIQLALKLTYGAPHAALAYLQPQGQGTDMHAYQEWLETLQQWTKCLIPLQAVTDKWNKVEFNHVINWWLISISDIIKHQMQVGAQFCVVDKPSYGLNVTTSDVSQQSILADDCLPLLDLQNEIYKVNGGIQAGFSHYNQSLLIESWLLAWRNAVSKIL